MNRREDTVFTLDETYIYMVVSIFAMYFYYTVNLAVVGSDSLPHTFCQSLSLYSSCFQQKLDHELIETCSTISVMTLSFDKNAVSLFAFQCLFVIKTHELSGYSRFVNGGAKSYSYDLWVYCKLTK